MGGDLRVGENFEVGGQFESWQWKFGEWARSLRVEGSLRCGREF